MVEENHTEESDAQLIRRYEDEISFNEYYYEF